MNEHAGEQQPRPPETEPTHTERWERAIERAFQKQKPPGGWPWQERKGKAKKKRGGA